MTTITLTPPQRRAWEKILRDRPVYTFKKMPTVRSKPLPVTDEQMRQALMYRVVGINASVIERLVELGAIKAEPVTKEWGHMVALPLDGDTPDTPDDDTPHDDSTPPPPPADPAPPQTAPTPASQPAPAPAEEPATPPAPVPEEPEKRLTLAEVEEAIIDNRVLDEATLRYFGVTTEMPKTGRFLTLDGNIVGAPSTFDPPTRYIPLPDTPTVPTAARRRAPTGQLTVPLHQHIPPTPDSRRNNAQQRTKTRPPRLGTPTWDVTRALEIFRDSWPDEDQPSAASTPSLLSAYVPAAGTSPSPQEQR